MNQSEPMKGSIPRLSLELLRKETLSAGVAWRLHLVWRGSFQEDGACPGTNWAQSEKNETESWWYHLSPCSCQLLWNVWLCHFSWNGLSSPNLPNTTATNTEAPLSPSPECQWHFLPRATSLKWSLRHLKLNQMLPEGKNEQNEVTVLSSQPGKRERTNRAGCWRNWSAER